VSLSIETKMAIAVATGFVPLVIGAIAQGSKGGPSFLIVSRSRPLDSTATRRGFAGHVTPPSRSIETS
jgi:hypothetical protein